MSKTPEIKVAQAIVNLTEDHWFNPTIFGRYLSEQPMYTIDRIMEMVVSIISEQSKIHGVHGYTSEGLMLAVELNECIKAYQEDNQFNSLKLPARSFKVPKREEPKATYKFGWRSEELDPFN
jgi:hypothetical protein